MRTVLFISFSVLAAMISFAWPSAAEARYCSTGGYYGQNGGCSEPSGNEQSQHTAVQGQVVRGGYYDRPRSHYDNQAHSYNSGWSSDYIRYNAYSPYDGQPYSVYQERKRKAGDTCYDASGQLLALDANKRWYVVPGTARLDNVRQVSTSCRNFNASTREPAPAAPSYRSGSGVAGDGRSCLMQDGQLFCTQNAVQAQVATASTSYRSAPLTTERRAQSGNGRGAQQAMSGFSSLDTSTEAND